MRARLDVLRLGRDDGLEQLPRLLVLAQRHVDARQGEAGDGVVGAHPQRALDVDPRVVELLIPLLQLADLQVGVELVRVDLELAQEGAQGGLVLAVAEQRPAEHAVGHRQLRVELDGLAQLGQRRRRIAGVHVHRPHQQVALGALAVLEDGVDQPLPLIDAVGLDEGAAQDVGEAAIAGDTRPPTAPAGRRRPGSVPASDSSRRAAAAPAGGRPAWPGRPAAPSPPRRTCRPCRAPAPG